MPPNNTVSVLPESISIIEVVPESGFVKKKGIGALTLSPSPVSQDCSTEMSDKLEPCISQKYKSEEVKNITRQRKSLSRLYSIDIICLK